MTPASVAMTSPWARQARRLACALVGTAVLLAGLVIFVSPAPAGSLVIPLGLTILAREFAWARKLLQALRTLLGRLRRPAKARVP